MIAGSTLPGVNIANYQNQAVRLRMHKTGIGTHYHPCRLSLKSRKGFLDSFITYVIAMNNC